MKFDILETKELDNGNVELKIEMDDKTKQFLLNYAILEILKNQLKEVEGMYDED